MYPLFKSQNQDVKELDSRSNSFMKTLNSRSWLNHFFCHEKHFNDEYYKNCNRFHTLHCHSLKLENFLIKKFVNKIYCSKFSKCRIILILRVNGGQTANLFVVDCGDTSDITRIDDCDVPNFFRSIFIIAASINE